MLTKSDLSGFYGTDNWHRHWTGKLYYTDGVKTLAEKGNAYWLIDAIASYQTDPRVKNNQMLKDMQFWTLKVRNDSAVLTCIEDKGRKPIITQNIEFTDFPLSEISVWVEKGGVPDNQGGFISAFVAMLPSER